MQRAGLPEEPLIYEGRTWRGLRGLFGRPFIDMEPYITLAALPELHEEICLALAQIPLDYTGGSHRSMGIMPEGREHEGHTDYGEIIQAMTPAELEVLRTLADDPSPLDPQKPGALEIGEERAIPLSRRQMRWLNTRFGVYFPWKAYVELIPNRYWGDKSSAEGKSFTRAARTFFPKTIEFVKSLPFKQIGRCNVMGLESFDHGTVHRDGDPEEQESADHFITFSPGGGKRLYLYDPVERRELVIEKRAFWFNDHDYHGVEAAPTFRYSVRVDGVFEDAFYERLARNIRDAERGG
jgi:hypothetical protein